MEEEEKEEISRDAIAESLAYAGREGKVGNKINRSYNNTITNDFMLGRCKNVNIPDNVYKTIQPNYPCDAVPLSYSDSKNYCYLSANTYKNIFDDVSLNIFILKTFCKIIY